MLALDLYAGMGGWSQALRQRGISAVGLDVDKAACATRVAAGHRTINCDLLDYPPIGSVDILCASPPCQTFSSDGTGAGLDEIYYLTQQIRREDWSILGLDLRTAHVLIVGKWLEATRPTVVLLEQVPQVLSIWEAYATVLRRWGYHAWAGILHADAFGVPQSRKRAILMAARTPFRPPRPTHERYRSHARKARDPDPDLVSFVSIGEAIGVHGKLGSRSTDLPSSTITGRAQYWTLSTADGDRKMSIPEALVLQSFPPDYPVFGAESVRFRQIANAIPPILAGAIIDAVR